MIRHNILDIFNERIYELGIKQKYIAEKMNITQDRLSRILSGKSNMLADEMITLCSLLDLEINPLLWFYVMWYRFCLDRYVIIKPKGGLIMVVYQFDKPTE